MKHFLFVALPAAVLLAGCPAEDKTCGTPDDLAPEGCSASELAAIDRSGVWHGLGTSTDGGSQFVTFASFHDPEDPKLDGQDNLATESGDTFFLSSEYSNARGQRIRMALRGCHSPDPRTITGDFQRCVNGSLSSQGTFQLGKLAWKAGETEGEGLELLGEARITQGTPQDVWVEGTFAYVSSGFGGMNVFDVSDPSAPELVSQFGESGQFWYEARARNGVLYVASTTGVRTYDLAADAVNPPLIGTQPTQPEHIRSLFIDEANNRLLANSAGTAEVILFNITNPRSPVLISRLQVANPASLQNVYPRTSVVDGDRLYSAYGQLGVLAATIAQPSSPTQLGDAYSPMLPANYSSSVAALTVGEVRWALDVGLGWNGHVRGLNFTSATAVTVGGEYVTRPEVSASQAELVGTRLYVAYHQDGVRVLDVSDPTVINQVAYFNAWSDVAPTRGDNFFDGVVDVHKARDGSAMVYAMESVRGLLVLRETP